MFVRSWPLQLSLSDSSMGHSSSTFECYFCDKWLSSWLPINNIFRIKSDLIKIIIGFRVIRIAKVQPESRSAWLNSQLCTFFDLQGLSSRVELWFFRTKTSFVRLNSFFLNVVTMFERSRVRSLNS